ncbi:hypothetical protein TGRUB_272380 [Toxoplasma gondii RUB]|uniref:Uncharacterized protein n=2 Tax=Toxoplasma gondii TaxID=5811 RepID=A0A086M5F9_TOXGO|nr:hypothetical protein TGRUB_272380 [Toxoplasma gondii RUB]KFH11757.1 hypothetical protein TGVAND_272380 [Toxoplasma gondii VAND]
MAVVMIEQMAWQNYSLPHSRSRVGVDAGPPPKPGISGFRHNLPCVLLIDFGKASEDKQQSRTVVTCFCWAGRRNVCVRFPCALLFLLCLFSRGVYPLLSSALPLFPALRGQAVTQLGLAYKDDARGRVPQPERATEAFRFENFRDRNVKEHREARVQKGLLARAGFPDPIYLSLGEEITIPIDIPAVLSFVLCRLQPSRYRGNRVGNLVFDPVCSHKALTLPEDAPVAPEQNTPSVSQPHFRFLCTAEWVLARRLAWEADLELSKLLPNQAAENASTDDDDLAVEEHRVRWFLVGSLAAPGSQASRSLYCSDRTELSAVIGPDTTGDIWLAVGWRVALAEGVSGEFTTCRRGICTKEALWGLAAPANTCVGSEAACQPDAISVLESAAASARTSGVICPQARKTPEEKPLQAAEAPGARPGTVSFGKLHQLTGKRRIKERNAGDDGVATDATEQTDSSLDKEHPRDEPQAAERSAKTVAVQCVGRGAVEVTCTHTFGHYVEPIQMPQVKDGQPYYLLVSSNLNRCTHSCAGTNSSYYNKQQVLKNSLRSWISSVWQVWIGQRVTASSRYRYPSSLPRKNNA